MLALKLLLTVAGVLLLAAAFGIPAFGLWKRVMQLRRKTNEDGTVDETAREEKTNEEPVEILWQGPVALALVACLPLLVAESIVVVPSGMGGVRVSQVGGTEPGTLYPGVHFITPLVDNVQMFDLRDRMFTAGVPVDGAKPGMQTTALDVQSR